jgi:DNA-binding transcriptional ArsR family regulator
VTTSPDPAAVFAALGDPVRLALLAALADGGRSISDLAAGQTITRQGVTKHLRVLEAAGLVASERSGREIRWRGRPQGLDAAQGCLARIGARWDAALGRLKRHAEGT